MLQGLCLSLEAEGIRAPTHAPARLRSPLPRNLKKKKKEFSRLQENRGCHAETLEPLNHLANGKKGQDKEWSVLRGANAPAPPVPVPVPGTFGMEHRLSFIWCPARNLTTNFTLGQLLCFPSTVFRTVPSVYRYYRFLDLTLPSKHSVCNNGSADARLLLAHIASTPVTCCVVQYEACILITL